MKQGQRYKVTFEAEFDGEMGSLDTVLHKFKLGENMGQVTYLAPDEYTAYEVEPPIGSVAIDDDERAWQRGGDGIWRTPSSEPWATLRGSWKHLNETRTMTIVHVGTGELDAA